MVTNVQRIESRLMKRIYSFLAVLGMVLFIRPCFAASYGDLYDIEWCPCDPEEQFNEEGSVVLGKTVMCPCDSMYDGYGRTLKKDAEIVKQATKKIINKTSNYKYYIGVDFNKSSAETNNDQIIFEHQDFNNPLSVGANDITDDQDNIGVVIGFRPHPNIGVEAFYNRTITDNETIRTDTKALNGDTAHVISSYISKYQAFGVDLIGYLPVTDYFDFVAFAGLGQYYFENEASHKICDGLSGACTSNMYGDDISSDFDDDTLAWRVGGGIQFNIGRGVVLRSLYRYINVNSVSIKNLQEFSVGIRFVF